MTHHSAARLRARAALLLLAAGATVGVLRWAAEVRPRADALEDRRARLDAARLRLAGMRVQLLRLGSEGIASRNRALRAEVERREALAPSGTMESGAQEVRERFAALAARYGVHASAFEPMPEEEAGGLRTGALRIRAAGPYHALGTWITEGLSAGRLLDVRRARLEAAPDSLTRALREGAPAPPSAPGPAAAGPSAPQPEGPLAMPGAAPLDAIAEIEVRWYALPAPAAAGVR